METNQSVKCHLCDEPLNLEDYKLNLKIPQLMKKDNLCFRCAFWHCLLEQDGDLKSGGYQNGIPLITPYFQHYILNVNKLWLEVSTFKREPLDSTKKYVAVMINDQVHIGYYNNWSFQGVIPAHLRELFTPNGITLTDEQINDLLNRKSFTPEDLKLMIDNCNK
jgi:hypothetical protein